MSEVDPGTRPMTFVRRLLRSGAPLDRVDPDDVDDAGDLAEDDDDDDLTGVGAATLSRAWRYVVLGPLLYRIAAFPKVFVGFASSNGTLGLAPALAATVVGVVVNVAAAGWVLRRGGLRARAARPVLAVDLAVGVVLNVVVAATAPASVQPFAVDVAWTWLVGSIAMWTCVLGVPSALWLLLGAVPFRAVLTVVGGLPLTSQLALNRSVGCVVALLVAVVTAAGVVVVLGVGARFALTVGILRGVRAERSRTRRMVHDGVLQTLDALAIQSAGDVDATEDRLSELRSAIKAQAAELRRQIAEPVPSGISRGVVAELADVAAEMARHGLRTQLVAADFDEARDLSRVRRRALCDAVRESLRNTVKHAGADLVVLRVEERDGGIAVVARDHGAGFDVRERPPGFGISQSILARLAEVGGHGTVESQPGRGTRVTMWVPH